MAKAELTHRGWFAAVTLLAAVLCGCDKSITDKDIKDMRVSEVKALWDKVQKGDTKAMLLIDARPTKEYTVEHIVGARNIQLPQIGPNADRDPVLEVYSNIVVYGNNPGSPPARGMVKRMLAVGYKGVRFFPGGMLDWRGRGYPTDGTKTPPEPPKPAAGPTKPETKVADPVKAPEPASAPTGEPAKTAPDPKPAPETEPKGPPAKTPEPPSPPAPPGEPKLQ